MQLLKFIYVGLGGFIGAVLRYALSFSYATLNSPFPLITLCINFAGSLLIGLIAETTGQLFPLHPNWILFLSTGVCGGFTTFSTFSLETYRLLNGDKPGMAVLYAGLSMMLCVFGIYAAKFIVGKLAA